MKKKITNMKKKIILHGECIVAECPSLPEDAIAENHNSKIVIVANSEVTGNHHVIANKPGVVFYNSKTTGKRYMNSSVPTNISCVMAERHTTIDIVPGTYVIGIQQEYDYIAQAKRNVAD
jgi:hypothetical protein